MKKVFILIFILCTELTSFSQIFVPSAPYVGDVENRIGHSNSTPSDNLGGMENSPSEIVQVGSNIIIAAMSGTDLGNFFIHKKNATTGANVQMLFVNISDFLGLSVAPNKINGMKYDNLTDRLYIYGSSSLPGYSGFIVCYNQTSLTVDMSFDNDGIQMFTSGDVVTDLIVSDISHLIALVNNTNTFKLIEMTNSGQWSANSTFSHPTKFYYARRIKAYPSKPYRYYVVGRITNGAVTFPGVWGIDRKVNKQLVTQFSQFGTSAQVLSSEGTGEFEDLCFPVNITTGICDIVAVGNSTIGSTYNGWSAQNIGIYVKYKGTLSNGPLNFLIDNTYSNQGVLPGNGIASNVTLPNKAFFTRCEVLGSNVIIVGSDSGDNNATVGFINSTGTSYSRSYIAPYSGADRVHFPKGMLLNSLNHLFLTGCDGIYGITSIKLISLL